MCEERHQRTWEAQLVPDIRVGEADHETGAPKTTWESDQPIVLRERESRLHGEGADVDKQPTKETLTGLLGQKDSANLPDGNSDESGNRAFMRKRLSTKSPVRENCTPGSARGLLGNWQSYRDLRGGSIWNCTVL